MARVTFAPNLKARAAAAPTAVAGATVREALDRALEQDAALRSLVLDDQGRLRRHVVVFVDGEAVGDRERLSDPVQAASEVYVTRALAGG